MKEDKKNTKATPSDCLYLVKYFGNVLTKIYKGNGKRLNCKGTAKRRAKANMNLWEDVIKRIALRKDWDWDSSSQAFIFFSSAADPDYVNSDKFDRITCWSAAAALWILDELKRVNKAEIINISDYKLSEDDWVNDFIDSIHSKEMVASMTALIQNQMVSSGNYRLFYHSQNAEFEKGKNPHYNEHQKAFMNIIELLDKTAVDKAVNDLKETIWKIVEFFIECVNIIGKCNRYKNFSIDQSYDNLEYNSWYYILSHALSMKVIKNNKFEGGVLNDKVVNFYNDFVSNFKIDDPYAACFAIYYLLLMGDDMAWLVAPIMGILNVCYNEFPWSNGESEKNTYSEYDKISKVTFEKTGLLLPRRAEYYDIYTGTSDTTLYEKHLSKGVETTIMLAGIFTDCIAERANKSNSEKVEIVTERIIDTAKLDQLEAENKKLYKSLKMQRHINNQLKKQISQSGIIIDDKKIS